MPSMEPVKPDEREFDVGMAASDQANSVRKTNSEKPASVEYKEETRRSQKEQTAYGSH